MKCDSALPPGSNDCSMMNCRPYSASGCAAISQAAGPARRN